MGLLVKQLLQPTAQALLAEVAATPDRTAVRGAGLGTCFQAVPFQCAIRVLGLRRAGSRPPRRYWRRWRSRRRVAADGEGCRRSRAPGPGHSGRCAARPRQAIPASSTGMARTLTVRVVSWGVRTGCHLPPRRPAGSAGPVTGTASPPGIGGTAASGGGDTARSPSMTVGTAKGKQRARSATWALPRRRDQSQV